MARLKKRKKNSSFSSNFVQTQRKRPGVMLEDHTAGLVSDYQGEGVIWSRKCQSWKDCPGKWAQLITDNINFCTWSHPYQPEASRLSGPGLSSFLLSLGRVFFWKKGFACKLIKAGLGFVPNEPAFSMLLFPTWSWRGTTKQIVSSNSNMILTRQTCGQRSGRAAGGKRRALAFYFSVRICCMFLISKCRS